MLRLVNNANTILGAMLFVLTGMCNLGCAEDDPFSWSIEQAKERKTLIGELTIDPAELLVDEKRIVFGPAWLERRPDGDCSLCFQLEKGNDLFSATPSPFFVLDDLRKSISERHGRDLLQFVQRIDKDADLSKMKASLIPNWKAERLKNIRFIHKP